MEASGEAQALALAAHHLGLDPFQLFNIGRAEASRSHPRPKQYRALIYAMAWWLDERELERVKYVVESNGAKLEIKSLFGGGPSPGPSPSRGGRPARREQLLNRLRG